MRKFFAWVCMFVLFVVIVVPAAIVSFPGGLESPEPQSSPRVAERGEGQLLRVFMAQSGEIEQLPLEKYLVGVVAAEMPARFETEALRAQAVAARTYALRRLKAYGGSGCASHPEADVCTEPTCCQAWLSTSELRQRWGLLAYPRYHERIAEAVAATAGLVVTYDHELIDPVYHATCGGMGTEDSETVWGNALPYLRHVACGFDEDPPHAGDEVVFTLAELGQRLGVNLSAPVTSGLDLAVASRTSAGRVKELRVGSTTLAGTEVRKLLGLNSTGFSWRLTEDDKVVFSTYGNGHAVGMCQYGANGLAKQGQDFRAILKYYYTGVDVGPVPGVSE
ncbi:MAG: stage II sporulation protein D [Firmicutes bacterium]|nr:stage II sporulation protein D [Bacillota bacterium]